jgi:SOS-response transcriptional repressor LexA
MRAGRREPFTTIHSEGGILPQDLLQRVVAGDRELGGLGAEDYHLAPGTRVNEEITRSWNRLVGAWAAFLDVRATLPESDLGTTATRERWLLPLFQELGYGRLAVTRSLEAGGRSFPVSHTWGRVPIHLVGFRVSLDHRTRGVAGAATYSPHGLVQELLNRSPDHLWGFVSNGLVLRLLRDNASLVRQAYLELDLEAMMEGEVFSDFVVAWLVCHQSRLEADRPEECPLERWSRSAAERGVRALEGLRKGVESAIVALGRGFLAHRDNGPLRQALASGALNTQDYYRELLRLVYRLLFLFAAEDRGLLLDPHAGPDSQERFTHWYSTTRLRRLAERRRGTRHSDLYEGLGVVARALGSENGAAGLALIPLGSFLWSSEALAHLQDASIANADLLEAIRALAFVQEKNLQRAVDYKNLGTEELGGVYESLLELHPALNVDAPSFELATAGGHERKTSGSYYTPPSLVQALLDSALDPVLEEAATGPDPETAILGLKVCDPASGSGHFVVAAAHRIAHRLASVRTGEPEPSPDAVRRALRETIGHCIYAVDVNDMAVELCKVNLWMEALEPGRPLSFLDAHIRPGNSLLGTTPALIDAGIPDEAFAPIEGDVKEAAAALRKRNRTEREQIRRGLVQLSIDEGLERVWSDLAESAARVEEAGDDSLGALRKKEEAFREHVTSGAYAHAKLLADTWCAAFVQRKVPGVPAVTQDVIRRLAENPAGADADVRAEVASLAEQYRFFHWHVEFPQVFRVPTEGEASENPQAGWSGGFDVVLGNPPWEQTQISEKEFFAGRDPAIARAAGEVRKRLIAGLATADPALFAQFQDALRVAEAQNTLLRNSGSYPLCGRGKINTYAVFAEAMRTILGPKGRVGCIVPTGIATDDTTKGFFGDLVTHGSLVSLFDFENAVGLFPGVGHGRYKFSLLTVCGMARHTPEAEFMFFAHHAADLTDSARRFTLSPDDFALLNPNTRTCPIFRTSRDAEITKAIYRRVPVLVQESLGDQGNPWRTTFRQGLFNMTSDSKRFRTREQLGAEGFALDGNLFRRGRETYLPLYEAKMVHHFDHRFGDYALRPEGSQDTELPRVPAEVLDNADYVPLPRYWVPAEDVAERLEGRWDRQWLLGWRDITNATNERTVIASVIPRVGVGHKFPLAITAVDPPATACWLTILNSFSLDYVARQKVGGSSLTYFILKQFPVPPPTMFRSSAPWLPDAEVVNWIVPRALELMCTASDLEPFARDLGHHGPPFRWDPERRFLIRAELDAAFFHLYGISRDDSDYIMGTFPIVRRKDEARHGEYRTRRVILEIYDAMAEAASSGVPYQTVLDPPPADPRVAHSARPAVPHVAPVLPFQPVGEPPEADRYRTCVPVYSLRAAAGAFGDSQAVEPDGWAEVPGHRLRPGMFVAQVVGRSMQPRIPDGSWCLFRSPVEGSRNGRIVLVQHHDIDDLETGGSYTVKQYRSEKAVGPDGTWHHVQIALEPLNADFQPIVLAPADEAEVAVVAELVDVLGVDLPGQGRLTP